MNFSKNYTGMAATAVIAVTLAGCETAVIDSADTSIAGESITFTLNSEHEQAYNDWLAVKDFFNPNATRNIEIEWEFADGTTATGKTVDHVFNEEGYYLVTARVKHAKNGVLATYTKGINVTAGDTAPVTTLNNLVVSVKTRAGESIENAVLTVNENKVTTDALGKAILEDVVSSDQQVLAVVADGYISQSIQLDATNTDEARVVNIVLKEKNNVQTITDIATTNTVYSTNLSPYGNVSVSFAPNSFVKEDGSLATGEAQVSITPWNAGDSFDMSAFLGDGVGIDAQGEFAQLLSYGSMTVEFTQNGEKLQLAEGKTATINMPLPFEKHYDGTEIKLGDSIPMWHFSESQGAWIEEGEGTVVEGRYGRLALSAEVAHFTTWNWDMKFDNPSSMFVQCQLPDGTAIACDVSAELSYPDSGYIKTKASRIGEDGVTIVNIDPRATVKFTASAYDEENETILFNVQTFNANSESVILTLNQSDILNTDNQPETITFGCTDDEGNALACSGKAKITYIETNLNSIQTSSSNVDFDSASGSTFELAIDSEKALYNVTIETNGWYDADTNKIYKPTSTELTSFDNSNVNIVIKASDYSSEKQLTTFTNELPEQYHLRVSHKDTNGNNVNLIEDKDYIIKDEGSNLYSIVLFNPENTGRYLVVGDNVVDAICSIGSCYRNQITVYDDIYKGVYPASLNVDYLSNIVPFFLNDVVIEYTGPDGESRILNENEYRVDNVIISRWGGEYTTEESKVYLNQELVPNPNTENTATIKVFASNLDTPLETELPSYIISPFQEIDF